MYGYLTNVELIAVIHEYIREGNAHAAHVFARILAHRGFKMLHNH